MSRDIPKSQDMGSELLDRSIVWEAADEAVLFQRDTAILTPHLAATSPYEIWW